MGDFLIVVWLVASIMTVVEGVKFFINKFVSKDEKRSKIVRNICYICLSVLLFSLSGCGATDPNVLENEIESGDKLLIEENIEISGDLEKEIKEILSGEAIKDVEDEESELNYNEKGTENNVIEEKEETQVEKVVDLSKARNEALDNIPNFSTSPYVIINNNTPFFYDSDLVTTSYEKYSDLDSLGRCTVTIACIGKDIMPTEERGNIGSVKPTGWHTVRYSGIDGNYLYNRCHLIGYQLTAENANVKNLITGTRYMNVQGMLPFENMVADYIKETNNHVLYRVTPIFEGNNLLASGVLMEAKSVEDDGKGVEFCVYCYNVQAGITINYATGESSGPEYTGTTVKNDKTNKETNNVIANIETPKKENTTTQNNVTAKYILNTSSKKVHLPSCSSVKDISEKNKSAYNGNVEDLTIQGYEPCGNCKPYVAESKVEDAIPVVNTPVVEEPVINTTVDNLNTEKKEVTYILNTNKSSMKFHYPSCSSVDAMKESNKKEFFGTREDAINQGFSPCGRCKP